MDDMKNVKFGLLKYEARYGYFNIGDYIQSLASKRFLPRVDELVSRERLNQYDGKPMFMILNGWFMQEPFNWPPSNKIDPLFISFHINKSVEKELTSEESILFYKDHAPIGCRDYFTRDLLMAKGIEAYFSGCITLTLQKEDYFTPKYENEIYLCDAFADLDFSVPKNILFRLLTLPKYLYRKIQKKLYTAFLIPKRIRNKAVYLKNYIPDVNYSIEEKFNFADEQLKRFSSARLVITSRIHVALPCLAFGTPVLFVHRGIDTSRLSGILELLNVVDGKKIGNLIQQKKEINWGDLNNPSQYKKLREEIIRTVETRINNYSR